MIRMYLPAYKPKRRKPWFPVATPCPIRYESVRPFEGEHGIEIRTMLLPVDPVLRLVPFKDHVGTI